MLDKFLRILQILAYSVKICPHEKVLKHAIRENMSTRNNKIKKCHEFAEEVF